MPDEESLNKPFEEEVDTNEEENYEIPFYSSLSCILQATMGKLGDTSFETRTLNSLIKMMRCN